MGERLARKVLLVGWDAADWQILHPLIAKGWMPHTKALIEGGASGSLTALQPIVCPMLWTSAATGKRPHKHGVHGFVEPRPDGAPNDSSLGPRTGIRPVASTSRNGKALWNILSQSGLRTHCIHWAASHPAEPINGVCISNRFALLPAGPGRPWPPIERVVHPASLADTLAELRVRPETLDPSALLPFVPRAAGIDQDQDRRLMNCAMLLARSSTIHAAATWCIENRPWDFAAVLYDGIELFCRRFIDYHPPARNGTPPQDVETYQHVVTAACCFHDMMLGRLLQLAGEETTVILVSDHGYLTGQQRPSSAAVNEDPSAAYRPQGLWIMRGPGIRGGAEIIGASLLDVTPTVLTLFGLPCGADMDGRPWIEAIDATASASIPDRIPTWDHVTGDAGLHPREDPASGDPSREAIQHLLDLGYVEPADETAQDAIRRTRQQSRYHLARALLDAGQPEPAATMLEPLFKLHPSRVAYAQPLFEAYLALERPDAARAVAESAGAHGVDAALVHLALAAVDLAQRLPAAALQHLADAERLGGPTARLQVLVGQGYRRLRRWEEAEKAFRKALEIDADDPLSWHGLATLHLAQDRNDLAADAALRALNLRPDYPEAHYHLGVALAGLQQAEEAAIALKRCLALRPGMIPAYRRLVELYQGPLADPSLARAYRREAHVIILQRRLRRQAPAPPWTARSPAPSGPSTP